MTEPQSPQAERDAQSRTSRESNTWPAARLELTRRTERGEGGRQALKNFSHRADAMVQQLFAEAGPVVQPVGVYALGGYGRRELCLHSDIDLLLLFGGPIGTPDERFLRLFLTPLWDLGLTVGHQVREVQDGARLADDNPEFLLALTDARPVAGDATLLDRFMERQRRRPRGDAHGRARSRTLIAERHARFNETLYQLEPDVKEAPGGLRDLFGAQTIARLTDPALLGQGGAGLARAGRCGGVPAPRPIDPAPRGQAPPQRAQPRAPGAGRRAARATRVPRRASGSSG